MAGSTRALLLVSREIAAPANSSCLGISRRLRGTGAAFLFRTKSSLAPAVSAQLGLADYRNAKLKTYMAANILPSGIGDLFSLAERMGRGLGLHGMWLLKGFSTPERFDPLLAVARETERQFSLARVKKSVAAKRFASADEELTAWLAKARLVVMLALGSQWSESWIAAGFSHRCTNVPKRVALRMELARRLTDFFVAHPDYEVGFAGVTATRGRCLVKKITATQANVQTAKAAASAKKRARDAAEKKLRRHMSSIIGILPCVIDKDDPRWLEFGLKQPRPKATAGCALPNQTVVAQTVEVEFRAVEQTIQRGNAAA